MLRSARAATTICFGRYADFMSFDAVLVDCDGVLVDSEPIANRVLRQMLNEAGWAIGRAECERIFIGDSLPRGLGFTSPTACRHAAAG